MTVEEFLAFEETSPTKNSYSSRPVIAPERAPLAHWKLSANLLVMLYSALTDTQLLVGGNTLPLHSSLNIHPDVQVIPRDATPSGPIFVAEIILAANEAFQRGMKAYTYRHTPTIQEYALFSLNEPLVEFHTRADDGRWVISEVAGLDAHCEFSSLGCSIPMAELYNGVLE